MEGESRSVFDSRERSRDDARFALGSRIVASGPFQLGVEVDAPVDYHFKPRPARRTMLEGQTARRGRSAICGPWWLSITQRTTTSALTTRWFSICLAGHAGSDGVQRIATNPVRGL
jgi:hypothetical protein